MRTNVGDEVTLRCLWAPVPKVADVLETETGRQYIVVAVRGKQLTCLVVRKNNSRPRALQPTMKWLWAARKRKGAR